MTDQALEKVDWPQQQQTSSIIINTTNIHQEELVSTINNHDQPSPTVVSTNMKSKGGRGG
jgi:ABC-type transport system substrate-binding protein